jgi:phosphate:Na+ symporter
MPGLTDTKKEVALMAEAALKMLQLTQDAFMEHDPDLISAALEEEARLNKWEESLTAELAGFGRQAATDSEKQQALIYADVVADLELVGDYCKDILERVQIKIEEKLLFSDDAVAEYGELYRRTEKALKEISRALGSDNLAGLQDLSKEGHLDSLVDEYRRRHNQRLIAGVCSPLACNMFLNILDFTAAIYYHSKKIARGLTKIKK